jgi:hypothetical protein
MIQKLSFDSDERGVSEVLGAILVFGILIVLLGIIQTQAVPAQNQEIEFNHNQEVQGDFAELQQSVSKSVRDGNRRSVSFSLGANYPSRLLFINPPDPSGAVRSTDAQTAEIVAQGGNLESPEGQVNERIQNPSAPGNPFELSFELRSLVYEPNYNEYQNPPSVVSEYGILYLNASDSSVVVENRTVVDGTTISLVSTAGDFDRSSAATRPLGVDAAPAPTTTVPIQHDSPGAGSSIVLTLPTRLEQEQWDSIVSGQSNVIDANVGPTANEVVIELESGTSSNPIEYELKVPRYEVDNSAPSPSPTYVATDAGSSKRVPPGEDIEVTAEVRDEYNNPIPGELVIFNAPGFSNPKQVRADENGRATVQIGPNEFTDGDDLTVTADSLGPTTLGQTQTTLQVGNPAGPVVLVDSSIDRDGSSSPSNSVTLTLSNNGTVDVGIDEIQLESAVQSLPGGLGGTTGCFTATGLDCPTVEEGPEQIQFVNDFGGSRTGVTANDGEEPEPVRTGDTLAAGASADLTLEFDPSSINNDDAAVMIRVKVFFFQGNVETYDVAFAENAV